MNKKELKINPFIIMGISTIFIVSCIILSIPLYVGFLLGILFTSAILYKSGYSVGLLWKTICKAAFEVRHLCLVILLIGATTSIWLSSGVVPTIMYYGFSYMEGINFLVAAFLIMVIVSLFMGTAVGSISTVGISLNGIGIGLGIPVEIMVGVIVSGAFIADKISPLSGLVNLIMTTLNKSYKELVNGLLITLIPTIIITAIVYYFIGLNYTSGDYSQLNLYKNAISEGYNMNLLLLILPLIVLALSILGVNSIVTIGTGVVIGIVLSIIFQGTSFLSIIKAILFGYQGNTSSVELNSMLVSGGMISMIEVILVVIGGVSLVKLFEVGNILMPLMNKLMKGVKTKVSLILRTGFISSLMTTITCDQTVGIILPAEVLKEKYKEFDLDNIVLARTISDTGVIIAPLMAWNVNSFLLEPIVGVSANQYGPYASLLYICPLMTIIVTYMLYRKKDKVKYPS